MAGMRAVDIVKYHTHFVKEGYSLLTAIHYVPNLKLKFGKTSSADGRKELKSVAGVVCGEIFSVKRAESEGQTAPSGSSPDEPASSTFSPRQISGSSRYKQSACKRRKCRVFFVATDSLQQENHEMRTTFSKTIGLLLRSQFVDHVRSKRLVYWEIAKMQTSRIAYSCCLDATLNE